MRELAIESQHMHYLQDKSRQRRQIVLLILFVLVYLLTGGLVFSLGEDWDFASGVYFATVTMSTVGFGDLAPTSGAMQAFAVIYAVFGVCFVSSKIVALIVMFKNLAAAGIQIQMGVKNESVSFGLNWPLYVKLPLWILSFFLGQLVMAGVYVGVTGEGWMSANSDEVGRLEFGRAVWHACTTAMTIGYGDVAVELPHTPSMRIWSTVHIVVSCFWLTGVVADLQRTAGREVAKKRCAKLIEARIDGDIIPTLVCTLPAGPILGFDVESTTISEIFHAHLHAFKLLCLARFGRIWTATVSTGSNMS